MQGNCHWSGCIGRVLIGLFFVIMGILNFMGWQTSMAMLTARAVPAPGIILWVVIAIEIVFGLLIVIGKLRCVASWILILLTIVIAVTAHNFWNQVGPMQAASLVQFLSDIAVIGGLLLVACTKGHCEKHCE